MNQNDTKVIVNNRQKCTSTTIVPVTVRPQDVIHDHHHRHHHHQHHQYHRHYHQQISTPSQHCSNTTMPSTSHITRSSCWKNPLTATSPWSITAPSSWCLDSLFTCSIASITSSTRTFKSSSPSLVMAVITFVFLLLNQCFMFAEQADSGSFSIEKLLEYNSLATCIGQIHKDFETCNTKGAEKAKSYLSNVELNSEWAKRLKCCGTWKLRDCWMKAAREKCTKAQADQVYKLPNLFIPGLEEECGEYTPESGKCTVPIWLIVLVVALAIFILVTCCGSVAYCLRKRNRNRYRRRGPPLGHGGRRPNNMMTTVDGSKGQLLNGASKNDMMMVPPHDNNHHNGKNNKSLANQQNGKQTITTPSDAEMQPLNKEERLNSNPDEQIDNNKTLPV